MNTNKNISLSLIFAYCLFLASCKKDSSNDNFSVQEMSRLLTKDTLKFESVIISWNSASERIIYKRNGNNNPFFYDDAWYKFDNNGNFKGYIPYNLHYNSSWEFLENGKKLRRIDSTLNFTSVVTILKLSKDTIEWVDTDNYNMFYRFVTQ